MPSLNICEIFHTHQGEGFHAGRRALFVRMPFCNMECPFCDTKFDYFTPWTEEAFLAKATEEPNRFAVITGGEPMLNKQTGRVISLLRSKGFEIACETNGTAPILPGVDFATISPKRDSEGRKIPGSDQVDGLPKMPAYFIHPLAFHQAHEFKYVVDAGFDFSILDRHHTKDGRRYSLSPEFGAFKESLERIQGYIKERPDWRISLQTHKWMGIA